MDNVIESCPVATRDMLKMNGGRWPDEIKDRARRMIAELGWTISGASNQLGVPAYTIRNWSELGNWIKIARMNYARRDSLCKARAAAPVVVPDIKPIVAPEEVEGDRIKTTLAQIDQIDKAIREAEGIELVRLIEAKAKLWSLVHSKPQKPRNRRSSQPHFTAPLEPEVKTIFAPDHQEPPTTT